MNNLLLPTQNVRESSFGFSRNCLLLAGLLVAASSMSGCANVSGALEGAKSPFSQLDTNDDGVLSLQETRAEPALLKSFSKIDTNYDSNLNPAEYAAAHAMIADVDFARLDFNSDGVISEREVKSSRPSLRTMFSVVDSDADRNISPSEYRAATTNLLAHVDFKTVDNDGDGVIDAKEARRNGSLRRSFETVDIDKDKLISKTEFKLAQQR